MAVGDWRREKALNREEREELPRRARRKNRIESSDVDSLLGVALQVPAGLISCAGEQCVGAGLQLGGIEEEFRLAILLRYGVVGGDGELPEGLAVGSEAVAEDSVVDSVDEQGQSQQGREANQDHALRKMLESGSECCSHGVRLYSQDQRAVTDATPREILDFAKGNLWPRWREQQIPFGSAQGRLSPAKDRRFGMTRFCLD